MKETLSATYTFANTYKKELLLLLAATYIAGTIGLLLPASQPYFQVLTPFNLLLSAAILLSFHTEWNRPFLTFCAISYLAGFFVEVAGVSTGFIFGQYGYGATLGYKILDVPLIIGINWLILTYSTGIICSQLPLPLSIKAFTASCLMVILDLFIEPVAIVLDFWSWEQGIIPIQNYIAWFVISFSLHILFFLLPFRKENPAAKYLYLFQLVFFIILCLFTIY